MTGLRLCVGRIFFHASPSLPVTMIHWQVFLVIFLSSFSTLAYEIVLTRIFSISLWYHFAFMIVSIAMLGLGASMAMLTIMKAK